MFLDHSTNTIYGIRSEYHLWYEGGLSRSSLRKVRFRLDDFAFRVILLSAAEGGGPVRNFFFCPSGHAAKILASGRKGEKKPLPLGGDCKCQMSAEVKKTLRAMVIGFLFFRVFSLQSFRPW